MNKFDAFIAANCTKLAHELEIGDVVRDRGQRRTVESIDPRVEINGWTAIGTEGTPGYVNYVNYVMSYTAGNVTTMTDPLHVVTLQPQGDDLQAAFHHVAHLKGAIVTYVD